MSRTAKLLLVVTGYAIALLVALGATQAHQVATSGPASTIRVRFALTTSRPGNTGSLSSVCRRTGTCSRFGQEDAI